MINLGMIWDNVFESIEVLSRIKDEKLQVYGDEGDNNVEIIKWLFYQEPSRIDKNAAGNILSGVLSTNYGEAPLIAEIVASLDYVGLIKEQEYLCSIIETVAKTKSIKRRNLYTSSITKETVDKFSETSKDEIALTNDRIKKDVFLKLKKLYTTDTEFLDEFELDEKQLSVENTICLLTILIAYSLLKVDYTSFSRYKKTTADILERLHQDLEEYISENFESEEKNNESEKENNRKGTNPSIVPSYTSLQSTETDDYTELDDCIHKLDEYLKSIVSIDDDEALKGNIRKLKNTIGDYFDFVLKVLNGTTDDEADLHLEIERHRTWLAGYIAVYGKQIPNIDEFAHIKHRFLEAICDFHIVAEACKTEMLLIEGTLSHDAEIYRKRIKIEELKQNYKDAYKQFASKEFEITKELDNLSKTHSSDIGAK